MKNLESIKNAIPHRDINEVLCFFASGIRDIFGDNLVGFYLTGSLSYGDFDEKRSDIDLTVVLTAPASMSDLKLIKKLHLAAEERYIKWCKRIECSYVPVSMLENILPPQDPRPYFGAGTFYAEADYGNEWIINNYLLHHFGISLIGPEFRTLVGKIDIKDVQKACVRDLHREWEPKIVDRDCLRDSHLQSYVVLNLCRILYTIMQKETSSKKVAAAWAMQTYPRWKKLIGTAQAWHYGIAMEHDDEVIKFIKFAVEIADKEVL